ncbi:MAG: EAL domain-containing protein [Candidatus Omnitrophica bacterium]|nr:EAL domain-containing protein [Candidatus Omnitrophota bacterium]
MPSQAVKKQILIVDGEQSYVKSLLTLLENHNFEAMTAISAQGTIQKAETLDIDLILLGEGLPDSDGFELCQRLKSNSRTEHIPVILLSHGKEAEHRIRGYHLGADDCIDKESEQDELFARMEAIWRRSNGEFKKFRNDRRNQIIQELSRIIEQGLIEPHFQPIYLLKPFRLFGLEVLSRPTKGTFIANAEELFKTAMKYDMYYPLEMLCWKKAAEIVSSKTKNEHLFFNCHPYIVENSKVSLVKTIFEHNNIPLNKVVLEITERSAVNEYNTFYTRLNEYRDHGFSFAIDDVGGGYASLESIVATRPEIVKIDQHIIRGLHLDSVKKSIVKFIVAFCKENQIVSIAEGVECKEEYAIVSEMGVDAVQGYYLFRPTPDVNLREMKDLRIAFS